MKNAVYSFFIIYSIFASFVICADRHIVKVSFYVKEETINYFESLLLFCKEVAERNKKEGNEFSIFQSNQNKCEFTVVEQWENKTIHEKYVKKFEGLLIYPALKSCVREIKIAGLNEIKSW